MKLDDLKKVEDEVNSVHSRMKRSHELVLYKKLHAQGIRIDDVNNELFKIKTYEAMDKEQSTVDETAADLYPGWYGV